jgi:hypothetical protein
MMESLINSSEFGRPIFAPFFSKKTQLLKRVERARVPSRDESRRNKPSVRFGGSRPKSWRAEDIQLAEVSAEPDHGIEVA